MDSGIFNYSMRAIEEQLNSLYEKIRLLEDVRDYTKEYVLRSIQEKEALFKEKLKIIEDVSDQYRDTDSIAYNVPFLYNSMTIKDRDGSNVPAMNIISGVLQQSGSVVTDAVISNISHTSSHVCYNNSYNNLLAKDAGRSCYVLDEPVYGGLKEEVSIIFDRSYNCNILNIALSNCSVENYTLIPSGKEVNAQINTYIDRQSITDIKLNLLCDKYQLNNIQELNEKQDSFDLLKHDSYKAKSSMILKDMSIENQSKKTIQNGKNFNIASSQYAEDKASVDKRNMLLAESGKSLTGASVTYKYNRSGQPIDDTQINMNNEAGIIENYGDMGFRYTPPEQITKNIKDVYGPYRVASVNNIEANPDMTEFTQDTLAGTDTAVKTKTAYYFGIDSIDIQDVVCDTVSGYISPIINIGTSSYIELSVTADKDISGLEFYILEDKNEYGIVPIEIEQIIDEKLFWNTDPRFTIVGDIQAIKKNGSYITESIDSIDAEEYENNTFSITYVPAKQSYLYYPTKENIRVKVLQRCDNNNIPVTINSITVLKHGGDKLWNI